MNMNIKPIDESKRNIDWEEVETKISIICRKFSNIEERYKDDLAQELRIHAFYYSDDYYDLHRKAVDFWRVMTRRVYPEIPFIDLEIMAGADRIRDDDLDYKDTLEKIKRELTRGPYKNVREKELDDISLRILDIIVEDIDGTTVTRESLVEYTSSKYHNGRINLSYLDMRMPEINYKRLVKAAKRLEEIVTALQEMGKI